MFTMLRPIAVTEFGGGGGGQREGSRVPGYGVAEGADRGRPGLRGGGAVGNEKDGLHFAPAASCLDVVNYVNRHS